MPGMTTRQAGLGWSPALAGCRGLPGRLRLQLQPPPHEQPALLACCGQPPAPCPAFWLQPSGVLVASYNHPSKHHPHLPRRYHHRCCVPAGLCDNTTCCVLRPRGFLPVKEANRPVPRCCLAPAARCGCAAPSTRAPRRRQRARRHLSSILTLQGNSRKEATPASHSPTPCKQLSKAARVATSVLRLLQSLLADPPRPEETAWPASAVGTEGTGWGPLWRLATTAEAARRGPGTENRGERVKCGAAAGAARSQHNQTEPNRGCGGSG